jgi:hypothetical protein
MEKILRGYRSHLCCKLGAFKKRLQAFEDERCLFLSEARGILSEAFFCLYGIGEKVNLDFFFIP